MRINKGLLFVVSIFFAGVVFITFHLTNKTQKELKWEKKEAAERTIPIERAQWEWKMLRNPTTNEIPANIREKELNFAKSIPSVDNNRLNKSTSTAGTLSLSNWSSIGPDNIGGRTRALAYDISDNTGNTILAGGVSGGMWRTTNGGTSWTRTTTKSQLAAVSCVTQDTRTGKQSTWYYGSGEGTGNSASGGFSPYRGNGLFKSVDGGVSWTQLASTANNSITTNAPFNYVWRVATDPSNTGQDVVYAATMGGIMRSLDGGTTWQAVLGDSATGSYTDVLVTSTGVVYATISQDANQDAGIWRSTTGNKGDWTSITPTSGAGWPSTYSRITLAEAPSNENIVYFFAIAQGSAKGIVLWKYTYPGTGTGAGDVNWSNRTGGLPSNFYIQGEYDQYVKVKPDNPDFVIIGGSDLLRSTNGFLDNSTNKIIGGTGATVTGDYPGHFPDQHWAAFKPGSPNVMLSANDGGVFRTDDVTATTVSWTELNNGYVTTQYYAIAIDNGSTSQIVTGGMQDRGNWFINPVNNHHAYTMDDGGFDGTFDAIADNGAFYYSSSQSGGINRANFDANGNKTNSADIKPAGSSGQMFVSPYILDLANTNIMYYLAGGSIWRSTSVSTATSASGWTELQNSKLNTATITAIGVSQANSAHVVYYGTDGGKVYRLDGADAGDPAKVDVTGSGFPANGYVSCIAVDKTNSSNAIAVFSNYGVISLFYTNDAGTNWANISGNLEQNPDGSGDGPSCRWASILHFGGVTYYYVATSTGVYSTNNISNGPTTQWSQEGASTIGNVVCPMVLTRDGDGYVAVGTHGNGAFTAKATITGIENNNSVIPNSYALLQNYPNPFNPSTKIKFSIPNSGNVKLTVYDNLGREVATVVDRQMAPGSYTENFDASSLSSGVYFYRIASGSFVQTRKMILLK